METDWSVAAGADDPVIETDWRDDVTGLAFVDLRVSAESQRVRIASLLEVTDSPALAEALALLNDPEGLLVTTKCDRWTLSEAERLALAEALDEPTALSGRGSYIDVLMAHSLPTTDFLLHEEWARAVTRGCAAFVNDAVRLDLIVRPARRRSVDGDTWGYGLTVYHYAAGINALEAEAAWEAALRQTVPVLIEKAEAMFVPVDEAAKL